MAFELMVNCSDDIPTDLRNQWPKELEKHGIECEIHPNFIVSDRAESFLPFRMDAIPSELIGEDLQKPVLTGFELGIKGNKVSFRSAKGRTCSEFALLCICAAELTVLTNGEYLELYSGKSYDSKTVIKAALNEIQRTLARPELASRVQHPFKGWR